MELLWGHWVVAEGLTVLLSEKVGGAMSLYLDGYVRLTHKKHRDSAAFTLLILEKGFF